MLTRQHFEIIARELRQGRPRLDSSDNYLRLEGYDDAVHAVAQALRQINPRFDTARFLDAVEGVDHA